MKRTELPSTHWQHLAADLLGTLPRNECIFVLLDFYGTFVGILKSQSRKLSRLRILQHYYNVYPINELQLSIHTDMVLSL